MPSGSAKNSLIQWATTKISEVTGGRTSTPISSPNNSINNNTHTTVEQEAGPNNAGPPASRSGGSRPQAAPISRGTSNWGQHLEPPVTRTGAFGQTNSPIGAVVNIGRG